MIKKERQGRINISRKKEKKGQVEVCERKEAGNKTRGMQGGGNRGKKGNGGEIDERGRGR